MAQPFYTYVINDRAIAGLFRVGQPIDAEARRISLLIIALARIEAPKSGVKEAWGRHPGSEDLWTKHERRGILGRPAQLFRIYPVANTASYARYVHEGTLPIVVADGPLGLYADVRELDYVGGRGGRAPLGPAVRGQAPNPWLERAGQRAARVGHRLRGGRLAWPGWAEAALRSNF